MGRYTKHLKYLTYYEFCHWLRLVNLELPPGLLSPSVAPLQAGGVVKYQCVKSQPSKQTKNSHSKHNGKWRNNLPINHIWTLTCNFRQCFLCSLLQFVNSLLHITFQIPVWILWCYVSKRVLHTQYNVEGLIDSLPCQKYKHLEIWGHQDSTSTCFGSASSALIGSSNLGRETGASLPPRSCSSWGR